MTNGDHAPALPDLAEIEEASRRIAEHVLRTPVIDYPALEDAHGRAAPSEMRAPPACWCVQGPWRAECSLVAERR